MYPSPTIMIEELAQYGIAGIAIGALVWVVRYLGNIIKNHISHNTQTLSELSRTNQKLADTISELLSFLRTNNGKKG